MRLAQAPIVEQLRAGGCRNVEGILEWSENTVPPRALPAHFVLPVNERAGASVNVGGRDQAVDVDFSVMLVVEGARAHQAAVADDLSAGIVRICDALVGWQHPAAARACDYAGGNLASAAGSVVVWRVRLTTRYHLRKER